MRQFRANAALRTNAVLRANVMLLILALAPLIYGLCANLVTGGSFAAALNARNLWVFPFLIVSGALTFIFNYMAVEDRKIEGPPDKRVENIITTVPVVDRVKRALAISSSSARQDTQSGESQERTVPEPPPETVDSLIADLFAQPDEESELAAFRAAWRLAALMGSSNVQAALRRLELNEDQLSRPRLKWLIRPGEASARLNDSLNIVQGRIGYLIGESSGRYHPPPPLAVDPYIAVALIAVRERKVAYHSGCPVKPHRNDVETIYQLYYARKSKTNAESGDRDADAFNSYLERLTYRDLGKLLRPDLSHTSPGLSAKQTELVFHVMHHFLDDELSVTLFDALSSGNQIRLAVAMLTASQWMSPADWQHWARTGHDRLYAPKLELASDFSFIAASGLAIAIIVMGCWQIIAWVSSGWSWYFGSSHFLITSPGWLKALLFVSAAVSCIVGLIRAAELGMVVAITGAIGLVVSILASPVVRVHAWIASWETAATVIICALICSALLAWFGIYYSDRRYTEEPVQLGGVARGRFSRIYQRSRILTDHEVGHDDWCAVLSQR